MRKALIVVAALILVVSSAAVFIVSKQNQLAISPAEVEAAAAAMLPGTKPVDALRPVAKFETEDIQVAIFAPGLPQVRPVALAEGELRVVLARPAGDEKPIPEVVRARLDELQEKKAEEMEVESSRPILLKFGGHPYPARSDLLVLKSNGKRLREDMTVVKANQRPVVVLITGPADSFDERLRDRFLSNCRADAIVAEPTPPPLPPLPGPGRRPRG
ncbi:MAG: hypothetical protein AB7S38_39400 [Vulcanimicrobiota bacterium]